MAQLNDLLVLGNSNLLGTVSAPAGLSTNILLIPTASNGTTYGVGTNGQVLKSNGTTVYWGTDNNNTYSTATSSTLGLVKIGYTQSGKNYPVQLSNGQMYVNVPWENTTYTITDHNPSLTWSTKSKVATIGSTPIYVTMPANPNTNTTYTIATGDSNGQIKVTPSSGSAYNVSIKGLGSAAYTASTAYATAAQGTKADNALPLSGGTMTGPIIFSNASGGNKASNYLSAGGGYSTASGRLGLKLVAIDQADIQAGLGVDLTGGLSYETCLSTGRLYDSTVSYITFATHTTETTAYKRLGYFKAGGQTEPDVEFNVNGSIGIKDNKVKLTYTAATESLDFIFT